MSSDSRQLTIFVLGVLTFCCGLLLLRAPRAYRAAAVTAALGVALFYFGMLLGVHVDTSSSPVFTAGLEALGMSVGFLGVCRWQGSRALSYERAHACSPGQVGLGGHTPGHTATGHEFNRDRGGLLRHAIPVGMVDEASLAARAWDVVSLGLAWALMFVSFVMARFEAPIWARTTVAVAAVVMFVLLVAAPRVFFAGLLSSRGRVFQTVWAMRPELGLVPDESEALWRYRRDGIDWVAFPHPQRTKRVVLIGAKQWAAVADIPLITTQEWERLRWTGGLVSPSVRTSESAAR